MSEDPTLEPKSVPEGQGESAPKLKPKPTDDAVASEAEEKDGPGGTAEPRWQMR